MPGDAPSDRDLAALRSLARRIDASDPGAQNNLGVVYHERGLYPEAIAAFTRALELDPRMAVARRNLERVQTRTGYYDRLIAELRERLRREPHAQDPRLELGKAYLVLGQVGQAAEEFQTLARMAPTDPAPRIQLGLVASLGGDLEQATRHFEEAVRLDPASSVARVHLGQALFNRGLADAALAMLREAIAQSPGNAEAHYLVGFVLGELGRHEEARTATRHAMELNPALATAQANLEIPEPGGQAARPHPRAPAAPGASGEDPAAPTGRAHLNLGLAFRRRGYLADALREYRLALEANEDRDAALQGLAEVHLLRHDLSPALELYDQLLAGQPGHADLWNQKGACLHLAGRRDEARAAWRRAVAVDPSNPHAWNNLGVVDAVTDTGEAALAAFEAALRARPEFAAARLNRALWWLRRGRLQEALEDYRGVLRHAPEHSGAWNGIGQVLVELRQYLDARNAFARAVEADPQSAVAHYHLGFCLSHLGRFDEALRETKRALELEPYYVPQRFTLTLDLHFEESAIPVDAVLSGDVQTADLQGAFDLEPGVLDEIFAELAPDEPAAGAVPAPEVPAEDPMALARDFLAKGLLEVAAAEVARALRRGAPAAEGAVVEGEVFARRGLFGEALERFRQARVEAPGGKADLAALQGEAAALVALGRGSEALAAAEELLTRSPQRAEPYALRAEAHRLLGTLGPARRDAEEACRRQPGDSKLLLLLGGIRRAAQDRAGALSALRAALQLDAGLVQAWYEVGAVEEELGHPAEAGQAYRRAVEILPTHLEATLALAWLLRRRGAAGDAVNLLVDFLLAEPTAVEALVLLGQALLDAGRPEEAARGFERALRFVPDHTTAIFHLGVARARRRRYADAVAAWERVVALAPTGPLAAQARRHANSARDLAQILAVTGG